MVRPLQSKYITLSLLLITVICVYLLVEFVCNRCSQGNLPWHLDYNYSRYLTVKANEYASIHGTESYATVDGLRIYKERSKDYEWYGLESLFKKELVFEAKDKDYIRKFILAAHNRLVVGDWEDSVMDTEEASKGCGRSNSKGQELDWFYVVMFDNTFMRAGYFLMIACKSPDKEYMNILVSDTSGFGPIAYYNESLLPIFRAINSY